MNQIKKGDTSTTIACNLIIIHSLFLSYIISIRTENPKKNKFSAALQQKISEFPVKMKIEDHSKLVKQYIEQSQFEYAKFKFEMCGFKSYQDFTEVYKLTEEFEKKLDLLKNYINHYLNENIDQYT